MEGSILTNRTSSTSNVQSVTCKNTTTNQNVTFPSQAVSSPLEVDVINDNGNIHTFHITGESQSNNITFTATTWGGNAGNCNLIPLSPAGTKLTIDGSSINKPVDFDLTLPQTLKLLNLSTSSGDIAVKGITSPMHLTSESGSIEVTESTLSGKSLLTTNSGSLAFVGRIDPGAVYQFETSRGGIDVTLPSDAAFQLDAQNSLGMITTDFPNLSVVRYGPFDIEAQGVVGNPSKNSALAHLILRSSLGAINLHMS